MKFNLPVIMAAGILTGLMLTTVLTTTNQPWPEQLLWVQTVVIAGGCLVLATRLLRPLTPRLTVADIIMAAWWLYAVLRTYLGNGDTPACQQIIGYTTVTATYTMTRLLPDRQPTRQEAMPLLLLAATIYEIVIGLWQAATGTSHHRLYLATGSMFNPGPYSAYVAMGMALAIAILHDARDADWHKPQKAMLLSWCAVVVVAGCLIVSLTRSRSAIIAVAWAVAWAFRNVIKRKYAVGAVAVATVATVALFYMKMGSAMGRVVIWRQAIDMLAGQPLFGVGIGAFPEEYGKQLYSFFADKGNVHAFAQYADVADYAFCDLLQVFAEQGIIGGGLCMAFVAVSLKGLYRHSPRLFLPFATLVVFSLFSYPMQLLPLQVVAVCMAACGQTHCRGLHTRRWIATVASAICSVAALCCHSIAKPRVEAQSEYAAIRGMTHSMFIADYYRLYPLCDDDKHFLFDFARLLQANSRHLDACAVLRQGTNVSGDPMFLVLMGNCFKDMRQYNNAVKCYDRAFGMLPNRIYPLYKKMSLYNEVGDSAKTRQTARKLLGVRPKVESSATRAMREEARHHISRMIIWK